MWMLTLLMWLILIKMMHWKGMYLPSSSLLFSFSFSSSPLYSDLCRLRYITEDLIGTLLEGLPFKFIIILTIAANAITIGVQTDYGVVSKYKCRYFNLILMFLLQTRNVDGVLQVFDLIFLTIFVMEILLKWYHGFFLYWKSGWNVFDLFVVALSLLGPCMNVSFFLFLFFLLYASVVPITGGQFAKLLRGFRAFRLLRSIRYISFIFFLLLYLSWVNVWFSIIPGLQIIVGTFVQSLPDMMNILYLLFLILVIFAVIGVTLFASTLPNYFSNVPVSIFIL